LPSGTTTEDIFLAAKPSRTTAGEIFLAAMPSGTIAGDIFLVAMPSGTTEYTIFPNGIIGYLVCTINSNGIYAVGQIGVSRGL
jgi:hypothetical protein